MERVLRKFHIPQKLRWKIIARTSRDNARTPFQWTGEEGAGFTKGRPWLGINHNCASINLAQQESDPDSIWNWYRDLLKLRRDSEVLRRGDFALLEAGEQVFVYQRILGEKRLSVALNFSGEQAEVSCRGKVIRSNYGRESFDGKLDAWEAVILE